MDDLEMLDGDWSQQLEAEMTLEEQESVIDEDLDEALRGAENTALLQALSYDRAFVASGPVVRVYENALVE